MHSTLSSRSSLRTLLLFQPVTSPVTSFDCKGSARATDRRVAWTSHHARAVQGVSRARLHAPVSPGSGRQPAPFDCGGEDKKKTVALFARSFHDMQTCFRNTCTSSTRMAEPTTRIPKTRATSSTFFPSALLSLAALVCPRAVGLEFEISISGPWQ